jgi:chromosome partitioning protein
MIVTVVGQGADSGSAILVANLALLRARAGRRLLLVDADPRQEAASWSISRMAAGCKPKLATQTILGGDLGVRLESLERRFHDILIHAEGRDTLASRAALISARLAVVPVIAGQMDFHQQARLVARLDAARMFNPGLRVLFVEIDSGSNAATAAATAAAAAATATATATATAPVAELAATQSAVQACMARVRSATQASTVIHAPQISPCDQPDGCCVCEAPERDARAAAEMKKIYREVFVVRQPCLA